MLTQAAAIVIERLQKSYGTIQAVKGISACATGRNLWVFRAEWCWEDHHHSLHVGCHSPYRRQHSRFRMGCAT